MSLNEKARNLQEDIRESAHKIWLAGLGAFAVASEEGNKLFNNLMEKGEAVENQGSKATDSAKKTYEGAKDRFDEMWNRAENVINDSVASTLHRMGVPTREEITQLTQRVDALMEAIGKLNEKGDDSK